jgi:hypothetical protein
MTTDAHSVFHGLWSKAAGQPGYVKADWKELEALALGGSVMAGAHGAFARLQQVATGQPSYDEREWQRLERLLF